MSTSSMLPSGFIAHNFRMSLADTITVLLISNLLDRVPPNNNNL
jgi:hypothetical protein